MELFVLLQHRTAVPSLRHATAREGLTPEEAPGLEDLPIDTWSQWVSICGSAPTEQEDEAIFRELFAWLAGVDGDWALFHDTWAPIAHRRGGRLVVEPDYRDFAAA